MCYWKLDFIVLYFHYFNTILCYYGIIKYYWVEIVI